MNHKEILFTIPKNFKIRSEIPHLALTLKYNDRRILYFYIFILALMAITLMSGSWNDSFVTIKSLGTFFFAFFILYGVLANIYFAFYVMWLTCGEVDLDLEDTVLTIHRRLFRLSKTDRVNHSSMAGFYQLKDGGKGRDSFDGWGLKIKTNNGKKISIVNRQPIIISDWLGKLLSEVYNIEFYPTSERK